MLLSISTTHRPATDLGYLLHKHPDRVQRFSQRSGTATVFYPEANEERCTASLLLEIDPVSLARSSKRSPDFSLAQYVNDRSYAASSLLGVAMADVFSTARSGTCKANQDLADSAIPLEIELPVVPCRGGVQLAHRLLEPLGWSVEATEIPLDPAFPEWGDSHYIRLQLRGTLRLADALNHLYVLLPVFDVSKHYWQSTDEVDKLMRSGEGWLAAHPESELITRRYLGRSRELINAALERLAEIDQSDPSDVPADDEDVAQPEAARRNLNAQRQDAVIDVLAESDATSVIDLGCGPGALLMRLMRLPGLQLIGGTDVSIRALQVAAKRLKVDGLTERASDRLTLFQSALTYEDDRFAAYDAAVLMEVIEHIDSSRHEALEHVVFATARPRIVIVTTPNREWNARYELGDALRHPDHRFEWTRAEFTDWCEGVAARHAYRVSYRGVGEVDDRLGTPTQLAVFSRD